MPAGVDPQLQSRVDSAGRDGLTFTGFGAATSGTASGTITLGDRRSSATVNGDSLKKLLLAGNAYANIHTTSNGGGEIRGQIAKQ